MPQSAERVSVEERRETPCQPPRKFFDEMRARTARSGPPMPPLPACSTISRSNSLVTKQTAAEELFRRLGITFAVYAEGGSTERLIPFDLIPRILDRTEWELVERAASSGVKAINVFLYDIYHDQEILKAGLVPPELVLLNPAYRPEMHRHRAAQQRLRPHRWHRSDPHRRARLLRARGQCAHAIRRLLRAREPRDHDAALSRRLCRAEHLARRQLSRTAARELARRGA